MTELSNPGASEPKRSDPSSGQSDRSLAIESPGYWPQQCQRFEDRSKELEAALREVLAHFTGARVGHAPYAVYADILWRVETVDRWREVLNG